MENNVNKNLKKLKELIASYQLALKKMNDACASFRGKEIYFSESLETLDSEIARLLKAAKEINDSGNDSLLLRFMKEIKRFQSKQSLYKKYLQETNNFLDITYDKKNAISGQIADLKMSYEDLETKLLFSTEIKEYLSKDILGEADFLEYVDELKESVGVAHIVADKNIEKSAEKSADQLLQDMKNTDSLESFKSMLKEV